MDQTLYLQRGKKKLYDSGVDSTMRSFLSLQQTQTHCLGNARKSDMFSGENSRHVPDSGPTGSGQVLTLKCHPSVINILFGRSESGMTEA